MSDDLPISELLETILESGRPPEEVCADQPQLLAEIRRRLQEFRAFELHIDDLFPASDVAVSEFENGDLRDLAAELPCIPGYEVQCVLGHGGMGVVFKAQHISLNRPVALKMLLSGNFSGRIERNRLLREAKSVALLSHPNIVQVHDIGECEGRPYFTMELVDGQTLAHKLSGAPWPSDRAAKLVRTLAVAVNAAHEAGIVHRDLKPGNVLLTTDGTPKISDFGLARRVDEDLNVTLAGTKIGTPCYMAPEQALGQLDRIGPATDVYSLGAILYELLTGRPPFCGESSIDIQRQLVSQDPLPPSGHHRQIPRDLDTICLTCLQKSPSRRYATAAALADDLNHFLRDEPITARRTGVIERTKKWTRRHPAAMVSIVGGLLLLLLLASVAVWSTFQQDQLSSAALRDLAGVAKFQQEARWSEARMALAQAQGFLSANTSKSVQQQFNQAASDLNLAIALDDVRLTRATSGLLGVYRELANQQYAQAFAQAHLGGFDEAPQVVATRVEGSTLRSELLAALDDWAFCTTNPTQRDWVLDVARIADSDPQGWNKQILNPDNWNNITALTQLTRTVPVETESLPLLLALGERLSAVDGNAAPFLGRVQQQHPDDFWANLVVGNSLLIPLPAQACQYYRVALAQRPEEPVGYCAVGDCLRLEGKLNDALAYYKKAIQLDPQYARGYSNLALALAAQGNLTAAIDGYHKSIELDPKYAWSRFNLGAALESQGNLDQAMEQFKIAIALEPDNKYVTADVRSLILKRGTPEQIWSAWRQLIDINPRSFDVWWGYPELTLFLGKEDEYRQLRRDLLRQFGDSTDPNFTEKIGRACLMFPGTEAETRAAAALVDRAVANQNQVKDWIRPYIVFAQGLSDFRQGELDRAIAIMRRSAPDGLGPAPQLILAMALCQQGKLDSARKILAAAVSTYDWWPNRANERDPWFIHILRRQAETMILRNLPAFLQGKYRPQDNDERLALLGVCEFNFLGATEAQLLTDAFAADPKLPGDIRTGLRSRAACAAALAGAGKATDAANLDDASRAHWRGQALRWLRSDLSALDVLLDRDPTKESPFVLDTLNRWIRELSEIRDPAEMRRLSATERKDWSSFWTDFDALYKRAKSSDHRHKRNSKSQSSIVPA